MKFHHIGYYVPNIMDAVSNFEKLGYKAVGDCVHDDSRRVTIQFLETVDKYYFNQIKIHAK
jgi:catechol 2,3-dioxygenase-like lactoylglutathione lyase family enzyme